MKFFSLAGGLVAFLLTFVASLHAENEIAYALRDGAVACFVGALLMRLFHKILVSSIQSRVQARTEEVRRTREELLAKLTSA